MLQKEYLALRCSIMAFHFGIRYLDSPPTATVVTWLKYCNLPDSDSFSCHLAKLKTLPISIAQLKNPSAIEEYFHTFLSTNHHNNTLKSLEDNPPCNSLSTTSVIDMQTTVKYIASRLFLSLPFTKVAYSKWHYITMGTIHSFNLWNW